MHGIVLDIECSKMIFLKMEPKKKRNELLPRRGQLHHDCEIHLSSLFYFFSFFFQIGNVDPDSRILLFPGSEKYGIIEFLELIMCLQRKTRENRYSCWFNYKVFRFFFFDVRILNIYIF